MGGSIGKVFKSVGSGGSVVGGVGDVLSDKNDTVKGTGQTVGDLKKIGYSDADIRTMGGGKPGAGVGLARGFLKGGLSNFPPPVAPRSYAPVQFDSGPAPMFDTGGYLGAANPYLNPSAAFYGG